MPYETHPSFCITNPNQQIWHNVTFAQFQDILKNNHIIFHNGSLDRSSREGKISKSLLEECQSEPEIDLLLDLFDTHHDFSTVMRANHFLISWSIGNSETEKMWRYKKTSETILIGSTCKSLVESINSQHGIHVGEIKYFDKDRDYDKKERILQPFLFKETQYMEQDENELRAIARTSGSELNRDNFLNWKRNSSPSVLCVGMHLKKLIHNVCVLSDNSESLRQKVKICLEKSMLKIDPAISRFRRDEIPYLDQ